MNAPHPFQQIRLANDPMRAAFEGICSQHMENFGAALEDRRPDPDVVKKRVRANTMLMLAHGAMEQARVGLAGVAPSLGMSVSEMAKAVAAQEAAGAGTNIVSQITDFITLAIHTSLDIYPRLMSSQICSIQPINKPSGYVFFYKWRDENDRHLSDLSTFDETYSNDPGEGTQIKKIRFEVSKQLVQAEYKKLMHEHSWEMEVALRSQYSMDISAMGDFMTANEIAWEVDRTVIDRMVAFAGTNTKYYFDPTKGGAYNALSDTDKRSYEKSFLRVTVAGAEVDMQAKIFRRPNWYLCGANVVKWLAREPEYHTSRLNYTGDRSMSNGSIIFSQTINDGVVWFDPQLDPDLMLMGYTEQADPFYAGYIFSPFSLASLLTAAFLDPNTLLNRKSRAMAFATQGIRKEQYAQVWLKAS